LYEGISRIHPFVDCNKRTALVTVFETCLMNRYYLQKLNRQEEVDFALKVASTDIDEFGYNDICNHFDKRIIPYKRFAAKRFVDVNLKCPFCGSFHKVIPGKCQCGKQLVLIKIVHRSITDNYTFTFTIKELSRLNKIRNCAHHFVDFNSLTSDDYSICKVTAPPFFLVCALKSKRRVL